jgi:hypothetical protein
MGKRVDGRFMCECGRPKRKSAAKPGDAAVNVGSLHREVMFDCGEYADAVIDGFWWEIGKDRTQTHTGAVSGAVLAEVEA